MLIEDHHHNNAIAHKIAQSEADGRVNRGGMNQTHDYDPDPHRAPS
jgi:hypothetical protein